MNEESFGDSMEYNMRPSRVLRRMRAGNVATCVKINLSDLRDVEIASMCGFDCVWVDMEHIPTDASFIDNAVRTATNYDTDVLTRVSKGCYSEYVRPLEGDSAGIMIPHVMSLDEAKQIVHFTKFHPVGRRPIDGGNADGKYCLVSEADYIKQANEERFVIIQIEDPEPMAELEEICALPGIDMIFFGPADFSQGIGKPYDTELPEIEDARRKIAACARKHGKWAGTVCGPATFDDYVEMGYTFLSCGADVVGLSQYYQNLTRNISGRRII